MSIIIERARWAIGIDGLFAFIETPWFEAGIGTRTYFNRAGSR